MASPAVMEPPGELMYSENVLLRILSLEKEHLRDDKVGHLVVNGCAKENDVVA